MEADKPSVSRTPFRHRSSLFYSWTSAAALLDSKAGSNARRVDVFDWRKKRFRGRNAEREDGGSGMNPSDRFVKWKATATPAESEPFSTDRKRVASPTGFDGPWISEIKSRRCPKSQIARRTFVGPGSLRRFRQLPLRSCRLSPARLSLGT